MVGITLGICPGSICRKYPQCQTHYIKAGSIFLGKDEKGNKHLLCAYFEDVKIKTFEQKELFSFMEES